VTKRTVTNGGDRTVATKGTGDWAVATEPDVVFIAKEKKPDDFNNWVSTALLEGGTSAATTIGGEPIWTEPARLGPPSDPWYPGDDPANYSVKNGRKPPRGEAEAATVSTNLKAEGHPVVRVKDKTYQNARNTKGEVMTEVRLMDLSGDGGDEGGAGGRTRGNRGTTKKPTRAPGQAGKSTLPPSGTEPVDQCAVLNAQAGCRHGRRSNFEGPGSGVLQVVSEAGGDPIRLWAQVNGPCRTAGGGHPVWRAENASPAPGVESSFIAKPPPEKEFSSRFEKIDQRPYTRYVVLCSGCTGSTHTLLVQAFHRNLQTESLADRNGSWAAPAFEVFDFLAGLLLDEAEMGPGMEKGRTYIDGFHGTFSSVQEVREFGDYRAYVDLKLTIDLRPWLHFRFRVDIVGLIIDIILTFFSGGGYAAAKPTLMSVLKGVGSHLLKRGARSKLVRDFLGDSVRKEVADKLKEKLANLAPIYVDVNVLVNLLAKVRTPGPDGPPVLVDGRVTGTVVAGVGASHQERTESIIGIPFGVRVEYMKTGNIATDVYFSEAGEVGVNATTVNMVGGIQVAWSFGDDGNAWCTPTDKWRVAIKSMKVWPWPPSVR
jgi:hypothetical protein